MSLGRFLELLKPVWKSQPIPKKQEGAVSVLVADSFESIVLTKPGDRDVVFYIYAPWLVNFDTSILFSIGRVYDTFY